MSHRPPHHSAAPVAIDDADGALVLRWRDGVSVRLGHARLRAACPCAWCRAGRLRGDRRGFAAGATIRAINPMGYGVQLVFDDGHDRGIYPWLYLRSLAE